MRIDITVHSTTPGKALAELEVIVARINGYCNTFEAFLGNDITDTNFETLGAGPEDWTTATLTFKDSIAIDPTQGVVTSRIKT